VGRSRVLAGSIPADAPQDPGARALESPATDAVYDLDVEVGRGSRHQTDRLLDLVGWCCSPVASARAHLELSDADRARGRARLEEALHLTSESGSARRVGLHPGAANELKCWPLESFVALGVGLASLKPEAPRIVVFDSPRERGRAAAVVAGLEARGVTAGLVPAGGIGEYAETCSALSLLVCNDSGVMHIAAAVGVPTVSFHSLGDPKEWAPRHDRAIAFHAPHGIGAIPVDAALAAARELLSLANP
jgi:ADP-heptose:LPS heptosyltransferase